MPFSIDDKHYALHAPPDVAAASTVTLMYAGIVDTYDDKDQKQGPCGGVGRDFHMLLKLSVSPANGNRRMARLSAWVGPSPEDLDDRTHVGMVMDDGNEAEIVIGAPTAFHLKGAKAPPSVHHPKGRTLLPDMTMFVEWSALEKSKILFIPTFDLPVGYLQMVERYHVNLGPRVIARLGAEDPLPDAPVLPQRPKDRAAPSPPLDAAKRARMA